MARIWRARICLLGFIFASTQQASGELRCPSSCTCMSGDIDGEIATCRLRKTEDYAAISQLSVTTKSLTCIVTKSFEEDLAHFDHLRQLQNLTLMSERQYSSYQQAAEKHAVSRLRKGKLFLHLDNLRFLSISLALDSFNASLLEPLRYLTRLEFLYAYMYQFDDFINIVREIGRSLTHIEELKMISVQRIVTPGTMIKLQEHIYKPLKDTRLKVLDLRHNKALVLEQGLVKYLPHLEVFRVGAQDLMVYNEVAGSLICAFSMNMMHEHLREYVLDFPKRASGIEHKSNLRDITFDTGSDQRNALLRCVQRLNITNTLCDLVKCTCDNITYFQIPCIPFTKGIFLKDMIKFENPDRPIGICIPPPPQLRAFVFLNFPSPTIPHNMTLCLNPLNRPNHVSYIDISDSDLNFQTGPWFGISGLKKVHYFNLQGNKIDFSDKIEMFVDMPELEVLLLGRNNLSRIAYTEFDFLRLSSLRVLDLENCDIEHMPHNSLSLLRGLEVLNVSMNHIAEFDVDVSSIKHLSLLNLSGNQISTLGKNMRGQLQKLGPVVLDLSRNPLRCFCEDIEFVQWLQSSPSQFARMEVTTCSHPTLSPVSPWKVDVAALRRYCIHSDAIISATVSGLGVALAATAILLVYKRRWRIRYWLYAVKESWKQRRQEERSPLLAEHYIYDAFVAYSSHGEERSWVHTTLREKLEKEHGVKLCMYHRDFKVGRDLAETIVEGINSSNKTLLILSPNFLNSGWCEFEVRMANEKVISERRDSVVIVIFKRLDQAGTRVPRNLARLIEKKIYIEWTDDPAGQRLFWRRLVDSIKTRASYNAFNEMYARNE